MKLIKTGDQSFLVKGWFSLNSNSSIVVIVEVMGQQVSLYNIAKLFVAAVISIHTHNLIN
jgi:hypothetical protein